MSASLKDLVKEASLGFYPQVIEIRQHIHQHPEPSFEEFKTSAYLQSKLSEAGISITGQWVKTGFMAEIQGREPGKTITLRADMDALPIEELNSCSYASVNKGWMHACGHDVHSACLAGAALVLNKLRDHWSGTVRFVFQPGEEVLPGGASLMLAEGMFDQFPPGKLIAQHVFPELPVGHVGFRSGEYMASTDEIHIKVLGKGGHGALPQTLKDPVLTAAHVIVALQQIVSRNSTPDMPSVLSIGKVVANGATNIIPSEVTLAGTFRTFNEAWRNQAHALIRQIVEHTCLAAGLQAEIEIRKGYPALVNDADLTNICRLAAMEYLGAEKVHDLELRMTAEDFAWFAQQYPACFYRLGTASANGNNRSGVHTATFNIDEEALITGTGLMAWLALKELV